MSGKTVSIEYVGICVIIKFLHYVLCCVIEIFIVIMYDHIKAFITQFPNTLNCLHIHVAPISRRSFKHRTEKPL